MLSESGCDIDDDVVPLHSSEFYDTLISSGPEGFIVGDAISEEVERKWGQTNLALPSIGFDGAQDRSTGSI